MTGFALGEVALGSLPTVPIALKVLGAAKTYCRDTIAATAHLSAKAVSATFDTSSATFNLALRGILHAQSVAEVLAATGIAPIVARGLAKIVSSFSPPSMASSIGAHSFFKMSGFPMPSGKTVLPPTRTTSTASAATRNFILTRFFAAFSNTVSKATNLASLAASLSGATSGIAAALGKLPTGLAVGLLAKTVAQASSASAAVGNVRLVSKAAVKAFSGSVLLPAMLLFANTLSVSNARARQSLSAIVMTAVGGAQAVARAIPNGRTNISARAIAAVGSSAITSGAISFIGRSASFARGNATFINEKLLAAVSIALVAVRGGVKVATGLIVESPAMVKATSSPSGVLGLIAHSASGVKDVATAVIVKSFHATSSITKTAGSVAANYSAVMTIQASSVVKAANHAVGKISLSQATSLITATKNVLAGSVNLLTRTRSTSQGFANKFLQTLLASSAAFIRARASITSLNLQMTARSLVTTFIEFGNHPPETIGRPVSGSGGADPVSGEVNNDQIEES